MFPPDQTVFMNWRKRDKGSKFITKEVRHHMTVFSDACCAVEE